MDNDTTDDAKPLPIGKIEYMGGTPMLFNSGVFDQLVKLEWRVAEIEKQLRLLNDRNTPAGFPSEPE